MKTADFIFYALLCLLSTLALFIHSEKKDIYFFSSKDSSTDVIYEQTSVDVSPKLESVSYINLARLNDEKYLVYFMSDKLYGILFSPNVYSTNIYPQNVSQSNMLQNNVPQNIRIDNKNWGEILTLGDKTSLFSENKTIRSFNTPIFYRHNDKLLLFVNGVLRGFKMPKIYMFESEIADVLAFLSNDSKKTDFIHSHSLQKDSQKDSQEDSQEDSIEDTQDLPQENPKYPKFKLQKTLSLGTLSNLNFYLSESIIRLDSNNFMLPVYSKLFNYKNIFAILNNNFDVQNMINLNNESVYKNLYKPLFTGVFINNSLKILLNDTTKDSNISYSCLVVYNDKDIKKSQKKSLYFQTCEITNGTLAFGPIKTSQNIDDINLISLATLDTYSILLYTNSSNSRLNLAIFDGSDFRFVKELDSGQSGTFISPHIIVEGSFAYIIYGNKSLNKIHTITLNKAFITESINSKEQGF